MLSQPYVDLGVSVVLGQLAVELVIFVNRKTKGTTDATNPRTVNVTAIRGIASRQTSICAACQAP